MYLSENGYATRVVAGTMPVIGGTASMYIIAFFLPSFLTLALGMSSAFHLILTWPPIGTVLVVVFVLIGLMTLQSPVGFVMILEVLRPEVRATSLGIIYAFGVTVFGGFAQLIVSYLWRVSGSFYAPALAARPTRRLAAPSRANHLRSHLN